jgi:hypothetical protein
VPELWTLGGYACSAGGFTPNGGKISIEADLMKGKK